MTVPPPSSGFRMGALFALNAMLLPLYAVLFLTFLVLVWLPLFPCRTGAANLRERLGSGFFEARLQLACVFMHYFFYLLEALVIWPLGLTTVVNTQEYHGFLGKMKEKYEGRGVLYLSGHYGNIESLGEPVWFATRDHFGRGFFTLAQPSRLALFTRIMEWYRRKRHLQVLLTNRTDLVRQLLMLVKNGESLALLVDQKPEARGIFLEFLGKPAAFPFRGTDIALRGAMPTIYIVSRRIVPGYFRIFFAEGVNAHCKEYRNEPERGGNFLAGKATISAFPDGDPQGALAEVMAGFAAWLEAIIRRHPLQWSWDYRKWSRALPGPRGGL